MGNLEMAQVFSVHTVQLYLILLSLCLLHYTCFCHEEALDTGLYPSDVIIGSKNMDDKDSKRYTPSPLAATYQTVLMFGDGIFHKFINESGYFLGFRWFNDHNPKDTDANDVIDWQIYAPNDVSRENGTTEFIKNDRGQYTFTMIKQTGWVKAKPGLNVAYLDQGLILDRTVNPGLFSIGFTVFSNGSAPVLYTSVPCDSNSHGNHWAPWIAFSNNSLIPLIGYQTHFYGDDSQTENGCMSFRMQGIYTKSIFALGHAMCSLYVAKEDKETEFEYWLHYSPFPFQPRNQYFDSCWIIRSEDRNNRIAISTKVFNLINTPYCKDQYISFEDISNIAGFSIVDTLMWGHYCGDSYIFNSRVTMFPYLFVSFKSHLDYYDSDQGFKFGVRSVNVSGNERYQKERKQMEKTKKLVDGVTESDVTDDVTESPGNDGGYWNLVTYCAVGVVVTLVVIFVIIIVVCYLKKRCSDKNNKIRKEKDGDEQEMSQLKTD